MAGNIKGITIEFDGKTTKLDAAIKKINKEANSLNKSLKNVDKALKFSPTNTELLAQKQSLLKQKVQATKDSLDKLKAAQAQMDAAGVDKSSAEYQNLRREIITTESKLKHFNAELLKANAAASGIGVLGAKFTKLGASATALGNKFKGVSIAAGVVSAGIGALAVKAGKAADDLNTMSKQYGIGTKDLQNYQSTAELVDVSVETLAKTHVKLKKNMLAASQSATGSAAKAFDALGVKVTGSNGHLREGNAVYDECIQKLAGMKNETERDAYAMAIFGKSAADLNPLLEGGAEQYKKFTDLMSKNKLDPVDQKALDKANEFNDSIDTIKATFDRAMLIIGTKLAGYLAPKMEIVSEKFAAIAGKLANLSPKALSVIGGIASAIALLAPAILIFGKISTGIGAGLTNLSILIQKVPLLGKAFSFLSANPIILIVAALVALMLILGKTGITADQLSDKITTVITSIAGKIPAVVSGIVAGLTTVISMLPTLIPVIIQGFTTLLLALVQAIPQIIPPLIAGFVNLVTTLANMLPTLIPTLMVAAVQLFMALVQAIPQIVVALVQALPQIVNAFKTGLQQTLPMIWDSIKNTAVGKFIQMVATIGTTIGKVVNAIAHPFDTAYNLVKAAMEKIKAVVERVKLKLDIKIPHISVHGGKAPYGIAGKGSLPSFNVNWYKTGGIFNNPSVIGVGEAGAEAVVPLDKLEKMMGNNDLAPVLAQIMRMMQTIIDQQNDPKSLNVNKREFGRLVSEVV